MAALSTDSKQIHERSYVGTCVRIVISTQQKVFLYCIALQYLFTGSKRPEPVQHDLCMNSGAWAPRCVRTRGLMWILLQFYWVAWEKQFIIIPRVSKSKSTSAIYIYRKMLDQTQSLLSRCLRMLFTWKYREQCHHFWHCVCVCIWYTSSTLDGGMWSMFICVLTTCLDFYRTYPYVTVR